VDHRVDPRSRAVTNAAFARALAETASRFANHFTKRLRVAAVVEETRRSRVFSV